MKKSKKTHAVEQFVIYIKSHVVSNENDTNIPFS
jgi:hypothetical protein